MNALFFVGAWFGFLVGVVAGLSLFNFLIYPHRLRLLRAQAKAESSQP